MTIRRANADDVPSITSRAHEAYNKYVARIGREPAPMVADFNTLVADGKVHVSCDMSGSIEGFIVFYPRGGNMHLENVAVSISSQGRGIGRKMIEFCEQSARKIGLDKIDLYTNEKMTENLALYPKLGYHETARREEDGFNRVYFEKTVG